MLGVKDFGRIPMAWDIRPGFRGDPYIVRQRLSSPEWGPTAYEMGMNLQGGAQNRVLCAE